MNNEQKGFIINKHFEKTKIEEIVKAHNKIWKDNQITENQVSNFLKRMFPSKGTSYSNEQERFLLERKAEGLSITEIAEEYNKVFPTRSRKGLENKLQALVKQYSLNNIKEDDNMPQWEEEQATRKQKRAILRMERPNEAASVITKMIDAGIYQDLTKKQASDRIQILQQATETLNSHLPKKAKVNTLSKKQLSNKHLRISKSDSLVIQNNTPQEAHRITNLDMSKIYAHRQYLRRKGLTVTEGSKGRPQLKEKEQPTEEILWTNKQDFDILCNFYELSIEEVRNRFNKTYQEVAGRLEFLFDSTQPEHIEMLMRASQVVNQRRQQTIEPQVLSRRESRKQRKQQRKEARQMRKISKLEKKMEKIRG